MGSISSSANFKLKVFRRNGEQFNWQVNEMFHSRTMWKYSRGELRRQKTRKVVAGPKLSNLFRGHVQLDWTTEQVVPSL